MVLKNLIKVHWSSPTGPFSPSPWRCLCHHRGWSACFLLFFSIILFSDQQERRVWVQSLLTRSPHFARCEEKKKKKKRGQHQPSFHSNSKIECRGNKRVPPTSLQGPSPNTSGGGVAGASPPPQRDHRGENKLGCLSPGASCREQGEEREIEEGGREGGRGLHESRAGIPILANCFVGRLPKNCDVKKIDGLRGREGTTLCSSWSRRATHQPSGFLQITYFWHDCLALVISLRCSWRHLSLSACTWILNRNIHQWRDTFSLLGRLVSHQTLGRNITAFFSCYITYHLSLGSLPNTSVCASVSWDCHLLDEA